MEFNATKELELSLEEFTMFRDFIHEKCGIFFAENKMYLVKNRLIKRMTDLGLKSYRDYYYHVKYDTSMKEFNSLMNQITTNETSFFRNEPQLLSFSDEVLPLLIEEKKTKKTLKIWSAGCSTGEEPYTLSIMLLEKLKGLSGWKLEIVANDISEQVLQNARHGEYSGITLRNVKPTILNSYFNKVGENYQVKPEVKALVNFSHLNLNDPRKIPMNSNFDVIFCRNVMIYFSSEIKKQLVRSFFNVLNPGGYFYIGHSETLHGISKAFKLKYFKNALVYSKEAVKTSKENNLNTKSINIRGNKFTSNKLDPAKGANRALDLLSQLKTASVNK